MGKFAVPKTEEEWRILRAGVKAAIDELMGKVPKPDDSTIQLQINGGVVCGDIQRHIVSYNAGDGSSVRAILLRPNTSGHFPAVICLHQSTRPLEIGAYEPVGLDKKHPNYHYALELARRGYVTISPFYPDFGTSLGGDEPKMDFADVYALGYESVVRKAIQNNNRTIIALENMKDFVDSERIGVIGHSLGGFQSMFLAATDMRVKVAVVSGGFAPWKANKRGLVSWESDRYIPKIKTVYHSNPDEIPFDWDDLLMAIAPRPVMVIAGIQDHLFDYSVIMEQVEQARKGYDPFLLPQHLVAIYPDEKHDFPFYMRATAYSFLDQFLK